jgi:AcrR family transcriptional regulator
VRSDSVASVAVTGRTGEGSSYHHGDLPSALVDVAVELIRENGPRGFSLAEAARRVGVSITAPYRHFADRDALLAAVALRAYAVLGPRLDAATAGAPGEPVEQLVRAAAAYVHFSVEERPLFAVVFGAGLDKGRYPELRRASSGAYGSWLAAARALVPGGDEQRATELAIAVVTVAHGHAALLADGQFGPADQQLEVVARRAGDIVRTLLTTRSLVA